MPNVRLDLQMECCYFNENVKLLWSGAGAGKPPLTRVSAAMKAEIG